jgi:hypothetical protein
MQEKGLVAPGGIHRAGEVRRIRLLEGAAPPERRAHRLGRRRGAFRPELDAEEVAVEDAGACREEADREGSSNEPGDVFRDASLEVARIRGNVDVEGGLRSEDLLRRALEPRQCDRLAEQLVEGVFPELARGAVDGGRHADDRREPLHDRDRLGEDGRDRLVGEEKVPVRKGNAAGPLERADEGASRPDPGQVDREAPVRRPTRQETRRVGGLPAEEGDSDRLERVRRYRGDEGGLVVVARQKALVAPRLEEEGPGGREGPLGEDGPEVATEKGGRVHDGDDEPAGRERAEGLSEASFRSGAERE